MSFEDWTTLTVTLEMYQTNSTIRNAVNNILIDQGVAEPVLATYVSMYTPLKFKNPVYNQYLLDSLNDAINS